MTPEPRLDAGAGYGPADRPRAIVLTFDNLGEASQLERGEWDGSIALGAHPSVTRALPRLLDELDLHGLRATFFVEAINCELNPSALARIAARGHELGVHGWRHEPWAGLSAGEERALLQRATEAFASRGLRARAFRPPGGEALPSTAALLRAFGYRWFSPAGGVTELDDRLARVPFDWELVDAYHLMNRFGDLRIRRGDGPETPGPAAAARHMLSALTGGRGIDTLVLHPFLMLDETWWQGTRRVLALVAKLSREGAVWAAAGGEFADWLMEQAS